MKAPYTLRKTKGGPRMMTLSSEMEQRLLGAPADAVRLTLQTVFQQITAATGEKVVLAPEQNDRLMDKIQHEPMLQHDGNTHLVWRWICQGARYNDAQDMAHFLDIASLAVKALNSLPSTHTEAHDV